MCNKHPRFPLANVALVPIVLTTRSARFQPTISSHCEVKRVRSSLANLRRADRKTDVARAVVAASTAVAVELTFAG